MSRTRSSWTATLAQHGEGLLYRIAGLPIAVGATFGGGVHDARSALRAAYAHHYWTPEDWADAANLAAALLLWPLILLLAALWFTGRNGRWIKRRCGRPAWRQFADQFACYLSAGILPPWYYIFSLHDGHAAARARGFVNRCETKRGAYRLLARHTRPVSPLGDKAAFAHWCSERGLPVAPIVGVAREGRYDGASFPDADLFVKPVVGRGGRGAERWDRLGQSRYRHQRLGVLTGPQLRDRLAAQSLAAPRLVQRRLINQRALQPFSNGALVTVRVLTCLDEHGAPEAVAAVFRMAIGDNRTVDNIHAGGIAATVDLASGVLSQASDLGMDARRGWLDHHPDTGAAITGTILPGWPDMRALALRAHAAFADRVCIGWDVALTTTGACLVEGNGAPDVDLMQRPMRRGLADDRLGVLLAHHLQAAERYRRRTPARRRRKVPV